MCAALLKKNSKDGVFQKCNALYTKNSLNDGVFQGYCAISTKKSSDYGALQDLQKEKGKDREGYQPAIIARNSTTNNPPKTKRGYCTNGIFRQYSYPLQILDVYSSSFRCSGFLFGST